MKMNKPKVAIVIAFKYGETIAANLKLDDFEMICLSKK